MKGVGWGVPEDIMKLLPGPAFEVEQSLDDKGLPCKKPVADLKKAGARSPSSGSHAESSQRVTVPSVTCTPV